MSKKHSLIKSFVFAVEGITNALKNERNFVIQIMIGILATTLALFLRMSAVEVSIIILASSVVLILELLNTSLEQIVNLASPEITPQAKIAKDAAAGVVLLASAASVLIGLFLFVPKIITYLN
ncbi:diacylglycerol kinase family protein [Patescibacteria group bacterium]